MYSTRLHANAAAAAAAAAATTDDDYFTATAIKLPTTAVAHTLMSNSSGCSRSCNVAVDDNHGNDTSPNLFTTYYSKAVHDFIKNQPPAASSSRH